MAKQKGASSGDQFDPKKAKMSLEYLTKMSKEGYDFSKHMKESNSIFDSISSQLFGMSKSDFFEKIPKSTQDMLELSNKAEVLKEILQNTAVSVNKDFKKSLFGVRNQFDSLLSNISQQMPEIAYEIQKAIESGDFSKMSKQAQIQFEKIVKNEKGFAQLKKFFDSDAVKKIKNIENELKKVDVQIKSSAEETMHWGKSLVSVGERLTKGFNFTTIKDSIFGFDKNIKDMQINSGIMFKNNSVAMADMTSQTQQYGMGVKEATEMMGELGAKLRTTDIKVLGEATQDMAAIGKATGISSTEVSELGGEMMMMGKSSKDVNKLAESTMKSAMNFGVNGRKIMQDIAKNLPKFRTMGFQGGEESLKRMALRAERLGQNIDEIFDMSKKARNIEGSMEMASELQLAGGSFANINPMDLLSAARKGPEELQKILGQMGGDIGSWAEESGKQVFKIGAADADRLNIVAEATGMSVDSLTKQITKQAQDAQKQKFISPDLFAGMDEEQKAFLLSKIGEDGKLSMSIDGVSDLNSLTKGNIKAQLETQAKEKGNIEKQAQENITFQESMANLKASIMNMFVFFEPLIKFLTGFIQGINAIFSKAPIELKLGFALFIAALAVTFSAAKKIMEGRWFGVGFRQTAMSEGGGGGLAGKLFGGGKKGIEKLPIPAGAAGLPAGPGGGGFLASLSLGLKSFGIQSGTILKGAATLAASALLIGVALIAITAGIAKAGGDASGGQLLTFGVALVGLSGSLWLVSKIMGGVNVGNVLQGSLAMGIIGLALIPFSYAMTIMQGVSWETLGKMAVAILGAAVLLAGLGFFAPLILFGAITLAAAGLSLMVFGASMMVVSSGLDSITKIDWSALSGMGPALLTIAAAGALGLIGSFGLIGMTFALMGLSGVMVVLAPAMSLAAASTKSMAEGITQLKEAIKGLDTSKLESLASASERMSSTSMVGGLANAISSALGGGKEEKNQKVTIEPITINLDFDGKTLRTILTKTQEATKHTG